MAVHQLIGTAAWHVWRRLLPLVALPLALTVPLVALYHTQGVCYSTSHRRGGLAACPQSFARVCLAGWQKVQGAPLCVLCFMFFGHKPFKAPNASPSTMTAWQQRQCLCWWQIMVLGLITPAHTFLRGRSCDDMHACNGSPCISL